MTSQSQWEAMRPHTIGKIAPSLCNGTRGEVRSGGAVGTLCSQRECCACLGTEVGMQVSRAKGQEEVRAPGQVQPWTIGT